MFKDACDNLHVPIQTLKNQLEKYTDASKRKELKTKLRSLEKVLCSFSNVDQSHFLCPFYWALIKFSFQKRSEVDSVVEKIINNLLDLDENAKDEIRTGRHSLNKQNFPCYKKLYTLFSEKCFNLPKVTKFIYFPYFLLAFVNLLYYI